MRPDDIPPVILKCRGKIGYFQFTKLFNQIVRMNKMPNEWRKSSLILKYKNEREEKKVKKATIIGSNS